MTVIAKKIAFAAQSGPARPDPTDAAQAVQTDILHTLSKWLGVDDLVDDAATASWARIDASNLPKILISTKGPNKTGRIAVGLSDALSTLSSCRLLGVDPSSDAANLAALKPFVDQNMLDLGARLSGVPTLCGPDAADAQWTFEPAETLVDQFGETDILRIEIDCSNADESDHRAIILLTPDLLNSASSDDAGDADDDIIDAANDRRLSPRLGPCQVDVRAVADRVRMSVADCSRLEIGQIVALPGLRFDQLELTIEMGDGPAAFVDAALGADKGQKAVRLNRGLDPSFRVPPLDPMAVSK